MTPGSGAFDAFLSYHSGDAEWVTMLQSALESRGVRVWIDREQLRPGDLFPGALAGAIGSIDCVVLILSRGALSSQWVEEEYSLALAHRRHVVPVLIDDVEPPGFLKGRTWVDFRDRDRFAGKVDDLVFGITGHRVDGAPGTPPAAAFDAGVSGGDGDEATILRSLIARRRTAERRLQRTRGAAAAVGVLLGVLFFVGARGAPLESRALLLAAGLSVPALAGWGVTVRPLSELSTRLEQYQILCDGLEACRSRSHPGCMKLRQCFWDMMVRSAAEAKLDLTRG